jgi:tetratricopeptide (TPR) repeat protein
LKFLIFFSLIFSVVFAQPYDAGNKLMLAQQFEQVNQLDKAKIIYSDLFKANPSDFMFLESLVRVCNKLKLYDESLTYLTKWCDKMPTDLNGINLMGKTYLIFGKEKECLALWDNFLKQFNYEINFTKTLAYSASEVKAFETAVYLLEKGKVATDQPIYFLLDLGYLYGFMMRYDKAAESYSQLLQLEPAQVAQIENRIKTTSNNPEAAKEYIKAFEKIEEPNEATLRVLLSLYIDQRLFTKSIETAVKLEALGKDNGVSLYHVGEEAFYAGDFNSAVTAYNNLLEKYPSRPDRPVINLNLVKALEELLNLKYNDLNPNWKPYDLGILPDRAEFDKVIKKYEEIISLFKNSETSSEAYFRIGYLYFKLKEFDQSKNYFDELINNRPNSPFAANAYLVKGNIEIQKGEIDKAIVSFKSVISAFSTDPDVKNRAKFNLMMCSFFKSDIAGTTEILTDILSVPTDNLANDALEIAPLMNKNMTDSLSLLKFAEGEKAIMKGDLKEAYKLFLALSGSQSKIMASLAAFRSAEIAASLDNFDDAIELINKSIKDPLNIYADKSLFLQGEIYQFGKKDIQKAISAYEQILIQFPNSILNDKARETILLLKTN